MRRTLVSALIALVLIASPGLAAGTDAEAATHGDEAARWNLVQSHPFPDGEIVQIELPVLSIYSYLVVSQGKAMIIDPGRDAQFIVDYLKAKKLEAIGVWLSHSHADFVAGHTELAKALSIPIYSNAKSGAAYAHRNVDEGSTIQVGSARLDFLATPGHTPDALTAVLHASAEPKRARAAFTGDFLFIGSVGRPDLLGGIASASWLAGQGFESWTQKVSKLPDDTLVLPAHGAGSLCGANLSDASSSTIGEQKAKNHYLQFKSKNEYVAAILSDQPKAPEYFGHNVAMNREGPKLVDWQAPLPAPLAPKAEHMDATRWWVLDLRDAQAYADSHVPNSVNVGLRGRLETWTGNMVPWKARLVLVGSSDEVLEARNRLHRIGYEMEGWLDFSSWKKAGLPVRSTRMFEPRALHATMEAGTSPLIIDVRLPKEWMGVRIGTVLNLPLDELDRLSRKIDRKESVLTVCNSAYRSSMGVGVLEREGFTEIGNLIGGGEAWQKAGLPVFQDQKHDVAASTVARRPVNLPDRLAPEGLRRMLMDLPDSFELVDLRPAAHFADYHLPGARNMHVADVIGDAAMLTGAGPLVLVCRDGSLSLMAAAILSQKTKREIKALHGGMEGYWKDVDGPGIRREAIGSPSSSPSPASPTSFSLPSPAPSVPTPPAPAAPPAKRRSAGC